MLLYSSVWDRVSAWMPTAKDEPQYPPLERSRYQVSPPSRRISAEVSSKHRLPGLGAYLCHTIGPFLGHTLWGGSVPGVVWASSLPAPPPALTTLCRVLFLSVRCSVTSGTALAPRRRKETNQTRSKSVESVRRPARICWPDMVRFGESWWNTAPPELISMAEIFQSWWRCSAPFLST